MPTHRLKRTLAWLVGYRRLQVRYERRADILLGLVQLACVLICLNALQQSKAYPPSGRSEDDSGLADGGERGRLPRDQLQRHLVVAAGQVAHVGDRLGPDDRHRVAGPQQPAAARRAVSSSATGTGTDDQPRARSATTGATIWRSWSPRTNGRPVARARSTRCIHRSQL
jgi:hypothetical protein